MSTYLGRMCHYQWRRGRLRGPKLVTKVVLIGVKMKEKNKHRVLLGCSGCHSICVCFVLELAWGPRVFQCTPLCATLCTLCAAML